MIKNNNRGFIGRIVLIIIAVIVLKYFLNFDIIEWIKSPRAQEIIQPVITLIKDAYGWLDNFVRNIINK